jgi:hypothetical protein
MKKNIVLAPENNVLPPEGHLTKKRFVVVAVLHKNEYIPGILLC